MALEGFFFREIGFNVKIDGVFSTVSQKKDSMPSSTGTKPLDDKKIRFNANKDASLLGWLHILGLYTYGYV